MPIAILIVNHRVYEDLDRALASVDEAVRPGDEVVVFDQESDEPRRAAVAARHPGVRWMPSARNIGFAAAINRTALETSAPWLLWFNPDALITRAALDALEAWLAAQPAAGCVGPRILNDDGTVQASARRFPDASTAVGGRSTWLTRHFPGNALSRRNLRASFSEAPTTVDWLAGSCVLTRRDLFTRLGGLDEGFFLYWEDADYCRRAAALGFTCTYLPSVTVTHSGGRSAARDPAPAIRAFHASASRMYTKHAGVGGRLVAPIVRLGLWARGEVLARAAARRVRRERRAARTQGADS